MELIKELLFNYCTDNCHWVRFAFFLAALIITPNSINNATSQIFFVHEQFYYRRKLTQCLPKCFYISKY